MNKINTQQKTHLILSRARAARPRPALPSPEYYDYNYHLLYQFFSKSNEKPLKFV